MLLQDSPHRRLLLQLLLPRQVENQQSQQDEEKHHSTHSDCDGRARSAQKKMLGLFLDVKFNWAPVPQRHSSPEPSVYNEKKPQLDWTENKLRVSVGLKTDVNGNPREKVYIAKRVSYPDFE